jgi:ABC-type multidrug transport system fused ATPase/permease subunit
VATGPRSDLRTIFDRLSSHRRRELGLLALLMPATAFAEALTVAAIVPFISLVSGQSIEPAFGSLLKVVGELGLERPLLVAALLFLLVVTLTAMLRLALAWTSRHFAFAVGHETAVEMQRRLLGQPYSFHLARHSSEHLAALEKVDLLVFDFLLQGVQAISAVMIGAFILALLVAIDPFSTVVAMAVIGSFYGVAAAASRGPLRQHAATISSAFEQRTKFVQDSVGGIRDLILDHSQEAATDRFRAIDAAFARARTRTAFLATAPRYLIEAAGLIVIALLAMVIAQRSGGITAALPFLGALALGALRLLPLMGQLYGASASLSAAEPILADVAAVLCLPLADQGTVPEPLAFDRSIEFRSVTFHYPDRACQAVKNLDLTIPKGARIAVTGRTGSGKSTLADLLMGLIQPSEGSILIDGYPLSAERLPAWRRSIAHVPQEIFLADDSIAANIALSFHGAAADQERVQVAAHQAQLHEFIEGLPDGYDTRIGERGVRLSGGQRQRLALARALYKDAPVMVLDEPTSSLDEATERAILEALDEVQSRGTTIVIVAHRPETMAKCNPIHVLEEGRLLPSGSHSELFDKLREIGHAG